MRLALLVIPGRLLVTLTIILLSANSLMFAQSEETLYRFQGRSDGYRPLAGVVTDPSGNLYGVANADLPYSGEAETPGGGVIFKMTPPAHGDRWTYSVLYTLDSATEGQDPFAALLRDSAGNLYGTTAAGGTTGCGSAFELSPPSSGGNWSFNLLHTFAGGTDGCSPSFAALTKDNFGNLYGITGGGGSCSDCTGNEGTVYELSPPAAGGSAWTETVIYSFGTAGASDTLAPTGTLLLAPGGGLYGTSFAGGAYGFGTVYWLSPPSTTGGIWTNHVLYSFTGGTSDGSNLFGGLIPDGHGGFYGTTADNYYFIFTTCAGTYCGHVFDLTPPAISGDPWSYTSIWTFSGLDGSTPYASLVRDKSGNLYGTTADGGTGGSGTIFKLSPPAIGGAWTESTLFDFDTSNGQFPAGNLVFGMGGRLYSTAAYGAQTCLGGGCGTVFTVLP
jgi:uncharacterized repeat protein (TIGR03803 family)